jgi:arylsulfatase A-like enzyme
MRLPALIALLAACALSSFASARQPAPSPLSKPNIVVILADDLGYGDLGVQGSAAVRTPHIDRLAREGVRMTDFYAAQPICAPSRAGLMTGRYQHRFGFEWNPGPRPKMGAEFGIARTQPTVSERLREVGYVTGAVGKWHMGYAPEQQPMARGFNYFYGFLEEAMSYTPEGRGPKNVLRGSTAQPMPAHTTEAFANEAVDFIDAHREKPFFLYVAFNAVHAPMQSTQSYIDRFASEPDAKRRAYLAMLAAMDDATGRIVDAVDRNGLGARTLVVFTSDNGAPTWQTTGANGPLNGGKATMLEGGIRVPTIFRWSGALRPGQVSTTPGIGQDIAATSLALAGVNTSALDGVNLMPTLTGRGPKIRRALYWRLGVSGAMRDGDWKLMHFMDDWYLFNLRRDIGERHNLAAAEPRRLARMRAQLQNWSNQMSPPSWTMPGVEDPQRLAGVRTMIRNYVATGEPGLDQRPLLYGGGPE